MNIKRYWIILIAILLAAILQTTSAVAAANGSALNGNNHDQQFDATAANKALNQIIADMNSQKISVKDLQAEVAGLAKFQLAAKKCVDNNTDELAKISQRLDEISTPQPKIFALTEEQKYLGNKKAELTSQLSECRLFVLRTADLSSSLNQKLRELVTTRLLYVYPDVVKNIRNFPAAFNQSFQSFDTTLLLQESGINFFRNDFLALIMAGLLLLGSIIGSIKLKTYLNRLIARESPVGSIQRITHGLMVVLQHYLPLLVSAILLSVFFSLFTHSLRNPSYLGLSSYIFLGYLIYLCLIRYFFNPPKPAANTFTRLPTHIAKSLTKKLQCFGTLLLLTFCLYIFFNAQDLPHSLTGVYKTFIVTALAINFIAILWTITTLPRIASHHRILQLFMRTVFIGIALGILIAEYLGYHLLALYLLHGMVMTVLAIFITRIIHRIIALVFESLKSTEQGWQLKFRYNLGLKRSDKLIELMCLQLLCYLLLWVGFFLYLFKIWGLAQTSFQLVVNSLLHGFEIAKFDIIPSRILIGTLLFIFLSLTTRWVRTYITRNSSWELSQGSRESLASIAGYVGFAIAFLIGALTAGVNFSGLAIIAGALSVGIGFGLQNIVNNFVSGIILLIERPIKPGDRIIVGDTEGYVRRISIRSTHIITTKRSDVIVPNSDLISKQVTNYMLYDMNYKVSTNVGIAYGSDTKLAKQLLLEVAYANPQVITDREGQEPAVYFVKFGDNSLDFELHCLIKDVDMKYQVFSDLNFEIEKTFREHGITIAYPQREINVLNWPRKKPPTN